MRKHDPTRHESAPSWYTPVRLLALLCLLNTAIYLDRGSFASNSVNGNPEKSTGFQVKLISCQQVSRHQLSGCSSSSINCCLPHTTFVICSMLITCSQGVL